jgi:hypothetical protein
MEPRRLSNKEEFLVRQNILVNIYRAIMGFQCNLTSPTQTLRMYINHHSKIICVTLLACFGLGAAVSEDASDSGDLSKTIAYVSLTTAESRSAKDGTDKFAPNVLVRFTRKDGQKEFLAITNTSGTATVPLEAGTYCVQAFGLDGHSIELSDWSRQVSHRCFTATPGMMREFSLTLSPNAQYVKSLPTLGVE